MPRVTFSITDDLTGERYPLANTTPPWLEMAQPALPSDYEVVRFTNPTQFTCPQCRTPHTINRHRDLAYGGVTYCAGCQRLWMLTGCYSATALVYRSVPKTTYIAAFAAFCQRQLLLAVLALPAPSETPL